MGRASESEILRRAVSKGLLAEEDLVEADDRGSSLETGPAPSGQWGPRLDRLLSMGRIDEIAVAAIAEELGRSAIATPDSKRVGSSAAPDSTKRVGSSAAPDSTKRIGSAAARDEAGATLPVEPETPSDEAESTRPVGPDGAPGAEKNEQKRFFGRYEILGKLGAGAGGEVLRAHDPRLARDVAIKLLHADRPELAARLRREAQAQARVAHENVCQVFEVGEVGERSFIAMQLVRGETLGAAAPAMTIEERVRVVRKVAEAVHAAHRIGLVHRDLKPGNVIVERDADGENKPWVVDFGLAREMERPAASMSGQIVGTPAFMAPEQARGETATIDRRCDVYALGATLFALLAGRPPFVGSTLDVLTDLLGEDAPPLRQIVPSLPADLETVVAKCLEKDPSRRYESARALADELGRFLDGEPILARPRGRIERAIRFVRRHRALVAVASASLAAVLVVASLWVRSALRSREQMRLSQQFGAEAQAIDDMLRVAHLLPAHDIRPDREAVRERMRALEASMARGGAAAEGPGHYALGRGALAIGDGASARAHLERAWNGGYRTPDVAYALGAALGQEYEAALVDALAFPAGEDRDAWRLEIAHYYRDPALEYLREARGAASESPALVEGLIAFREDRHDEAIARLEQAQREVPSLYEARRLLGDVYRHQAVAARERGDVEGALALARKAAEAYGAAEEIARSDEAIHVGACALRLELLTLERDHGAPIERASEDAMAACDRALAVDPDSVSAYRLEAGILSRVGEAEARKGKDPRPTFARAVALAGEALKRDPNDGEALHNQGLAWLSQADFYEKGHGIDPRPSLHRAIDSYDRAVAIHPTPATFMNLSTAWTGISNWESQHGGDVRAAQDRAIECSQRALALAPRYALAHLDIGYVYSSRAIDAMNAGKDPTPSVEAAVAALGRAVELNPKLSQAWSDMGSAWLMRAAWERAKGVECRPSAEKSAESQRKAIAIKPDMVLAYQGLADAWYVLALQQMDRGLDPSDAVKQARSAIEAARARGLSHSYLFYSQARVETVAARYASGGPAAEPLFAAAIAAISRSLEMEPNQPDMLLGEADARRWEAEWRIAQKKPAADEIARGLDLVSKALHENPESADALALRGAFLLLDARGERDPARKSQKEADGHAAIKRALEMNPLLKKDYPEP